MANSSDDFSQVISEEVTCPICLEELKEPKILLCAHNICRECLERMSRNKNVRDIVCPVCRKPTRIPKGGVENLPTNAALARVVEATLARKAKIEIKKSLEEGKPMLELLAKKISNFDKVLAVLNDIHKKADEFVDAIRNQEASLCREVEQFYGIKGENINGEKKDLGKLHSSASRSVQDAETILERSSSDPTKTINVAKAVKEQIEKITKFNRSKSHPDTTAFDEDLEFVMNGEANITSIFRGEKFGKVTVKKKVTDLQRRNTSKNCMICNSKATHYCIVCKKRSCKLCTIVVTRLCCDGEHYLVEEIPTTDNEKADLGSKDVCSFCGVTAASHDCIYCSKKSCGTCRNVYTKDPCVLSEETHYFVDQQHRKSTLEKQETVSQKQTTLSVKDKKPDPLAHGHVTGENYCEFCGLAANLICRPCLITICDFCKCYYKQDLCPPTKREHQFENINEQSTTTNETESRDSSSLWSCGRCTVLNSPTHRICAVCATSRGVNKVDVPRSGTRKCQNCTYANEEGATVCKMCSCTFGLDNLESYI